jgi:ElaB/YqjD/DUF883 family membrane-anchored ribosome-binding protein
LIHRKTDVARAWQIACVKEMAMTAAKDQITDTATGAADEIAAQLRRLQDDLATLKETMAGVGKKAEHETKSMVARAEAFARENPRTVLAGAIGFGLVLGLLLRRH